VVDRLVYWALLALGCAVVAAVLAGIVAVVAWVLGRAKAS
jgi:hypothetical protein